jgi:hypothetical protein
MSSPTDFRPVIELLLDAWQFRRQALDVGDMAGFAKWSEAMDVLFDRWLAERPDLRWPGDPLR